MSIDKEISQQVIAKNEQEDDTNIWRTDTTVLEDETVLRRDTLEIAQDANRLVWAAMWVSVFAVVISVVNAAIVLPLR